MDLLCDQILKEITKRFAAVIDKKFEEVLPNLITRLEAEEIGRELAKIRDETAKLQVSLVSLRDVSYMSDRQLDDLDNLKRRNNLILSGLDSAVGSPLTDVVQSFVEKKLELPQRFPIKRVTKLGSENKCNLKVEFEDEKDTTLILRSAHKLKNSAFGVNRDFSIRTRRIRRQLFRLKK